MNTISEPSLSCQLEFAPPLVPDLDMAEQFLAALDAPGKAFTFQTFDDSEQKRSHLARILTGTLHECTGELACLNEQGAGVFVMVNEGDGRGRKAGNVVGVRAVFVDLDGSSPEPVVEAEPEPDIIVESSQKRFHAYWLASNIPLNKFTSIQKALAKRFGGDPSVCDLPRVMRVPGFWHQKREPFRTRLVTP